MANNQLEVLIKWILENPYEKRLNILRKAYQIRDEMGPKYVGDIYKCEKISTSDESSDEKNKLKIS